MRGPSLTFRPTFHKYANEPCGGVHIHVTSPLAFRPVATYIAAIAIARDLAPEAFRFRTEPYEFIENPPAFDLLTGSDDARKAILAGASAQELIHLVCPPDPGYAEVHARSVERVARLADEAARQPLHYEAS